MPALPTFVVNPFAIWKLAFVGVAEVPIDNVPIPATSNFVVVCGRTVGL